MGSLTPGDDDDAIVGNLVDKLRDGDFENVEDDEAGIAISILMTLMVIFKMLKLAPPPNHPPPLCSTSPGSSSLSSESTDCEDYIDDSPACSVIIEVGNIPQICHGCTGAARVNFFCSV